MFGLNKDKDEVVDPSVTTPLEETTSVDEEQVPLPEDDGIIEEEEVEEELPEDFPKEDQGPVLGENEELVEVNGVMKIKITNPEDGTTRFK